MPIVVKALLQSCTRIIFSDIETTCERHVLSLTSLMLQSFFDLYHSFEAFSSENPGVETTQYQHSHAHSTGATGEEHIFGIAQPRDCSLAT